MTDEEAKRIAADVDRITAALAPLVAGEEHLAASIALSRLAAEHVFHDTRKREDFDNVCDAAWSMVEKAHVSGSCTH